MKCGFCGFEFEDEDGPKGCGGCPGGCHSIHCPKCGYKNPVEPDFIKSLRSVFKKKDGNKGDPA